MSASSRRKNYCIRFPIKIKTFFNFFVSYYLLIYLQTNRDAHSSAPGVQQHPPGHKRTIVVGGGGGSGSGGNTSSGGGLTGLRKWTARPSRNGLSKVLGNYEDSHRESHSKDTRGRDQEHHPQNRPSRANSITGSDMSMLQLLAFVISLLFLYSKIVSIQKT